MTFSQFIESNASKKITIVEIDAPLTGYKWINYEPYIWYTRLTPGNQEFTDDNGNTAYWDTRNTQYYNVQSLNIDCELYPEASSLANCISTEKTWFYDSDTTDFYIHFEDSNPYYYYERIAFGVAVGFTKGIDNTTNNYFEDVYYEPLVQSVPNLQKQKDALFYGILQYQGGSITFDNTNGYFDDFSQRDLYGQPIRVKLSFEGLPFDEALTVYTGKVEDFIHTMTSFTVNIADIRKTLSRKLPINTLSLTDWPDMEEKLDGTPIPIAYGSVINGTAYKVTDTTPNTYVFCDTTYNAVASSITVVDKDGAVVSHSGTVTDGTFTATSDEKNLYVSFSVPSVTNGLDIIEDVLSNYESIDYNITNFDTLEWEESKIDVADSGIWIGKGALKSAADIIELICIDNNGIFDVLPDGRFTFRMYDGDRIPTHEIFEDELLMLPQVPYKATEYLSSAKVAYNIDIKEKDPVLYTNDSFESKGYGRYRQYKERKFDTTLVNKADAITLSDEIMEQSKFIYPSMQLQTKIQNSNLRVLDNVLYEHKRPNGNEIIPRSLYQVLGVTIDLNNYTINATIKQIRADNNTYFIIDGGTSSTDYDYYDGGTASTPGAGYISGGAA
jgi:hypothetical protein